MSAERLDELGVPRRAFLRKAAAAALTAPLIVSFGMDAIAEASTTSKVPIQTVPNQCIANQSRLDAGSNGLNEFAPQYQILRTILEAVEGSSYGSVKPPVQYRIANILGTLAWEALVLESSGECESAFKKWKEFIENVRSPGGKLPEGFGPYLIELAEEARDNLEI